MTIAKPLASIPDHLAPSHHALFLEGLELPVDIGFHDFEVGNPQRLCVTAEVWLEPAYFAATDDVGAAWNYDVLREDIRGLAAARRFNLQETFARAVYTMIAARPGVIGLRVRTSKLDVYPDCAGVGVELASFRAG